MAVEPVSVQSWQFLVVVLMQELVASHALVSRHSFVIVVVGPLEWAAVAVLVAVIVVVAAAKWHGLYVLSKP